MILHVEKRWEQAVLILPNGETVFLKQEGGRVCQITSCQCAVHPGNSHPSLIIFAGKTVEKRVNEILTEHGERLTLVPYRDNSQSVINLIEPEKSDKSRTRSRDRGKPR